MDAKEILDIPMADNDSGENTIRAYLKALLFALWGEGESFSGKRPFGNSGWDWDLYKALIAAKAIPGEMDEDGDISTVDEAAGRKAIHAAIAALQ
jgi:hypothetical protein